MAEAVDTVAAVVVSRRLMACGLTLYIGAKLHQTKRHARPRESVSHQAVLVNGTRTDERINILRNALLALG